MALSNLFGWKKEESAVSVCGTAGRPGNQDLAVSLNESEAALMDMQTCLKKLQHVGVLSFATIGMDATPQIRCISAIHYEPDAFLFFYSKRGKEFCRELLHDGHVQILAYTVTRK